MRTISRRKSKHISTGVKWYKGNVGTRKEDQPKTLRRTLILTLIVLFIILLKLNISANNVTVLSKFNFDTYILEKQEFLVTPDQRIENQLLQFFEHAAIDQVKPDSSINKLISLRISAYQGGFGNIMIGIFAIIMESYVEDRFPIINNCIILTMFQHPNPSLSFLRNSDQDDQKNNCAFDRNQLEKYSPNPDNIVDKKEVNNQAVVSKMKKDGILKKYALMLQMDEGDPRLYDIVSSAAAKWMMQKPTSLFKRLVDEKKKQILSQCGNADKIDFAIQLRTWRDHKDAKEQRYTRVKIGIEDCIRGWLENVLHKSGTFTSENKACVYVTSDDLVEIKSIVEKFTVANRVNFVISQPSSDIEWHSLNSFEAHRIEFDPKLLAKHEYLIDWMIFGEAIEAIYTLTSTFGRTARMRRGYVGQKYDFLVGVGNDSHHNLICRPVQGTDLSSMTWKGSGTLEFKRKKIMISNKSG